MKTINSNKRKKKIRTKFATLLIINKIPKGCTWASVAEIRTEVYSIIVFDTPKDVEVGDMVMLEVAPLFDKFYDKFIGTFYIVAGATKLIECTITGDGPEREWAGWK